MGVEWGASAGSTNATPASNSQNLARTAGSAAASADEPTVHVAQCVVDLMWQTRSWWPNGSSAAASTYKARTTLSRRPTDPRGNRTGLDIFGSIIRRETGSAP